MKNAFEKIKQLLPYCDVEVDYDDGEKIKYIGITANKRTILSNKNNRDGSSAFYEGDVTKITPIPRIVPEIKGLVDIIDCKELREMAKNWCNGVEMIGQKGLKIYKYISESNGERYEIYAKDEVDYWCFPVWAVIPHVEDEETEEDEIIITEDMVGKKIKVQR